MSEIMSREQYHAHHALSSGQIKDLTHSISLWQHNLLHKKQQTKSMELGELIHMYFLEREKFNSIVFLDVDKLPRANSKARDDKEHELRLSRGLTSDDEIFVLSEAENLKFKLIIENAEKSLAEMGLSDVFKKDGDSELPVFFNIQHEGFTLECRALFDRLYRGLEQPLIVDIKTTAANINMHEIQKTAANFKFGIQEFWYRKACEYLIPDCQPNFVFLLISTVPPFQVALVTLGDDTKKFSERQVKKALSKYLNFKFNGVKENNFFNFEIDYPKYILDEV